MISRRRGVGSIFRRAKPIIRQAGSRGFTIIEVLIVLAISALLLASTATVFSSRRQSTEFSQAVYDIQSKFQSWASSVSSGSVPGQGEYRCQVNAAGTRPALTYSPSSGMTGQDCVYIGQAVEAINGGKTIYTYPVFGLRTVHVGGADTGVLPTTVDEASPEVPLNSAGSLISALVESYTSPDSLTIMSAKANTTGTENDILTLYSSLNTSNVSGNEIAVTGIAQTLTADTPATVQNCVENSNPCAAVTKTQFINNVNWDLCVTDGSRKAKISIKGVPTGITVSLDMNGTGC